ncbi:GNAT family N-acetyltransferase [Paenibacillus sp. J2TS4]|uniref:GNAT family N-acetyltransferase n=1 Tax=Paenibacillus sp. J2TS4 TaxID=2807194 RepID=UPI001B0FEFBE|nr:GNAT family N-acetyltransferase [Paenibacillus sp. J2TS4]GIP35407.1 acetyltransferase [Paenibacillus sp. J2TS4]
MKWHIYTDPEHFMEQIGPFLKQREAENNLALGILTSLAAGKRRTESEPLMAAIQEGDEPALVLLMTPPNNLILVGETSRLHEDCCPFAVKSLLEMNVDVPGVIGDPAILSEFIKAWEHNTGCTAEVVMSQRIYRLDRVTEFSISPGRMRRIAAADTDLAAGWLHLFAKEIGEQLPYDKALTKARSIVEEGTLFFWEDGGRPVSMAMKTRPTANGSVVSMVYTPPEFRGRGYATSCVASLSSLLLEQGYSFCTLYTDLANNTSNKIYQNIGYRPIQDSIVYRFV